MSCFANFAKYIIFFFNFLIAVCGLILLAFGIVLVINEDNGVSIFESFSVGGFAIGLGAVIFIIAFLGCWGAIRENSCLLLSYAVILIALFVTQATLGILAFVNIRDTEVFRQKMYDLIVELFRTSTSAVDAIQSTFECCGIDGPSYYQNHQYPESCCANEGSCFNPFPEGCARKFADTVENNLLIIGYVAIAFAVVEILGAIFAFVIQSKQKSRKAYV